MSIFLYFLGGWLLLNVLFALGMYFRPTRRKPVDPSSNQVTSNQVTAGSGDPLGPGELLEVARGRAAIETGADGQRRPAAVVRLLLFGLWLGDNRHSA